jgi:glutamate synthase domain-containing protein 2
MLALGCIQVRHFASGNRPTGITTMDPAGYRAIDIDSRVRRVMTFHKNKLEAVAEMLGAAGIDHLIRLNCRYV